MNEVAFAQPDLVYPKRKIYLDYLAASDKLASFYRCYPANQQALSARVDELSSGTTSRDQLAQSLLRYNTGISASPATLHNARLLADPDTLVVITGQQPGFAGGPLYNVYKAVTAVKLAAHLSRTTGKNVVPVFWIASEDANVQQVNRISLVDHQGQFRRVRVPLPDTGLQISSLRADQTVLTAFNDLMDMLPPTNFRQQYRTLFQPRDNEPWGQWFARIYAHLFAPHGLILLEPRIVYPHAGEIFSRIFARFADLQSAFDTPTAALSDLAYTPQISPKARATLYTVHDKKRQPITTPPTDYDPAEISCSVMFRPIVQDSLLPTVAYVAGPGEIAYFAQLSALYRLLDVPMPVIWPRSSMTLVPPDIASLLKDSALTLAAFLSQSTHDVNLAKAQLQNIQLNFRPKSQPQERLFTLLPYLVYYGPAVLDRILTATDVFDFRHRIVYVSEQRYIAK